MSEYQGVDRLPPSKESLAVRERLNTIRDNLRSSRDGWKALEIDLVNEISDRDEQIGLLRDALSDVRLILNSEYEQERIATEPKDISGGSVDPRDNNGPVVYTKSANFGNPSRSEY